MKVEWDVKIERGRKSSTRKSGVKSSALMLERERLALEMAEKFSPNLSRNLVQVLSQIDQFIIVQPFPCGHILFRRKCMMEYLGRRNVKNLDGDKTMW